MSKKPLRFVVARLKAEAQQRKLTVYRLSKLTGITQQTIHRLFAGDGTPTLDTVDALATALGQRVTIERAP